MHNHYNKSFGYQGESIAEKFLKDKGFEILVRNFTVRGGEIDIIALKDNSYRFIEVKTRSNNAFSEIEETITPKKIRTMKRAVQIYFAKQNKNIFDMNFGFDFIGIILHQDKSQQITFIPNFVSWMD